MPKRKNSQKKAKNPVVHSKALDRYLQGARDPAAVNAAMKMMGIK